MNDKQSESKWLKIRHKTLTWFPTVVSAKLPSMTSWSCSPTNWFFKNFNCNFSQSRFTGFIEQFSKCEKYSVRGWHRSVWPVRLILSPWDLCNACVGPIVLNANPIWKGLQQVNDTDTWGHQSCCYSIGHISQSCTVSDITTIGKGNKYQPRGSGSALWLERSS